MLMQHAPKIDFYKKRPFSDKLNITFVFLRENAWPYLKVQLLIAGPILLLVNMAASQLQFDLFDSVERGQGLDTFVIRSPDSFIIDMFGAYGLVLLASLVGGSLIPVLCYGYMRVYQERPPEGITIAHVTRDMWLNFLSMLGYGIIAGMVVIVSAFFLFIPAIYFMVVLSLGAAIICFEKTDPFTAFGRCFTLIKDKWFSTAGLLLVVGIIVYFITAFFSLPQIVLMGLWTLLTLESGDMGVDMPAYIDSLQILFAVLQSFAGIFTYSVVYIAIAFQYFNLVERRESRGLMARIGAMDEQTDEEEGENY